MVTIEIKKLPKSIKRSEEDESGNVNRAPIRKSTSANTKRNPIRILRFALTLSGLRKTLDTNEPIRKKITAKISKITIGIIN